MTVTQAIRSCNSQNEIRSVLMVRKSCINPSVTSLSLEERNVAELLATGWDRHTGSNGCLAVISSRRYITAVMGPSVLSSTVCVLCLTLLPAVWGEYYFSSLQSMLQTPSAVWSSPGWSVLIGFHSVATALALQLVFQLECTLNPLPLHYLVFHVLQLNTATDIRTRLVTTTTVSNVTVSTAVVTVPRGTAAPTRDTALLKTAALKGVLLFWSCLLLPHDRKKNICFNNYAPLNWNIFCVLFHRTNQGGKNKLPTVLGSTLGTIFPLILIVGVIICCVAPCCFCYKKCRKGGNRGRQRRAHFWPQFKLCRQF